MTGRKYDDKMNLDMPFAEALERFVATDPKEMHANIAKAKKAKPPGGRKAPPPVVEGQNVTKLRKVRERKRNGH